MLGCVDRPNILPEVEHDLVESSTVPFRTCCAMASPGGFSPLNSHSRTWALLAFKIAGHSLADLPARGLVLRSSAVNLYLDANLGSHLFPRRRATRQSLTEPRLG